MNNDSQLLTPQEVAAELQLNLLTIYRYIRDKKILASKFGRKYRISKVKINFIIGDIMVWNIGAPPIGRKTKTIRRIKP